MMGELEELEESEVIFSEFDCREWEWDALETSKAIQIHYNNIKRKRATASSSLSISDQNQKSRSEPVKIPEHAYNSSSPVSVNEYISMCELSGTRSYEEEEEEEEEEGGCSAVELVPPHLIVARRVASKTAFSFNHPLKGRNLSLLRNSILRLTGFLEP